METQNSYNQGPAYGHGVPGAAALAGRTIKMAELIRGTERGELVLLVGDDWYATIHSREDEHGQACLSSILHKVGRVSDYRRFRDVTLVDELVGVTVTRAENLDLDGVPAIALYEDDDHRKVFFAGYRPGHIAIGH